MTPPRRTNSPENKSSFEHLKPGRADIFSRDVWLPREAVVSREINYQLADKFNHERSIMWSFLNRNQKTGFFETESAIDFEVASPFYYGGRMVSHAHQRIAELMQPAKNSIRYLVINQVSPKTFVYSFKDNYELEILNKFIHDYIIHQESLLGVVDTNDKRVFFETDPGMAVIFDIKDSWDDTHAQREDVRFFLNYIADDYETKVLIAPILRALRRADEWLMLRESLFLRKKFQGKLD